MLTLNDGRKELYQWDTGRTATVDIECDVVHFANLQYGESLAVEVKEGKVDIPNKLLTSGAQIYCWAFVKDESGAYTKKEQAFDVIKRAKPSDYVYTETEVITIKTAVENALQEAKESGEFKGDNGQNGADGETPYIQDGYWYIGGVNTNVKADGTPGKDGQDGADGYSPTANVKQTDNGAIITITDNNGTTTATVTNGKDGEASALDFIPNPSTASVGQTIVVKAVDETGKPTEWEAADVVSGGGGGDIPEALPNPYALTFTGAVTGSYDGSAPVSVEIPQGGSNIVAWRLLLDTTLDEDVVNVHCDFDTPVQELLIKANIGGDGTNRAITLFSTSGVGYGKNMATFADVLRTDANVSAWLAIYAQAFKNFAFFRCQYYLYNNYVGRNTPMFNASEVLFTDQTFGTFVGENFPCINIGCWKDGMSGVIKAGTRIEILGR